MSRLIGISTNLAAFLDMIAVSEGTARYGKDDGYNVIVGGTLLLSYDDHPRRLIALPSLGIKSSAAGRYQFIKRTWDGLAQRLALPDFSPTSQDRAAIELLRRCKALDLIERGQFARAVTACRLVWASLPGAGYGQHENNLERLTDAYTKAGGQLALA